MIWILVAVCIAAIAFCIRLFQIKRQLHNIIAQLDDHINEKSEKKITVSLIDGDLNKLVATINRSQNLQKKLRIEVRRNDHELKDSIANLSHDLRTPLTSILGYLQLSRNLDCPAKKQEEYLQIVHDKAHALESMINGLYELSVLDVKETVLKKEKLDLNLLLADVLAGQYELFPKIGIDLNVSLPDYPIWIIGDRMACTRIIQNLLNNTTRYAREKTEITLEKDNSCALLSICNPAPNLAKEDAEHLFERFYTADKSRNSSGTGLGLYIVKTLLEQMNGNVIAAFLNNQILCIKIELPLSK